MSLCRENFSYISSLKAQLLNRIKIGSQTEEDNQIFHQRDASFHRNIDYQLHLFVLTRMLMNTT